jgi:hypothetical protein
MRDFTSVCRIQINLVIAPPIREMEISGGPLNLFSRMNFDDSRNRP